MATNVVAYGLFEAALYNISPPVHFTMCWRPFNYHEIHSSYRRVFAVKFIWNKQTICANVQSDKRIAPTNVIWRGTYHGVWTVIQSKYFDRPFVIYHPNCNNIVCSSLLIAVAFFCLRLLGFASAIVTRFADDILWIAAACYYRHSPDHVWNIPLVIMSVSAFCW